MWRRIRLPLMAMAVLLAGLMALLATLQYRWLGQISEAERERMQSTLRTNASEFALDVDRELTRAYLLFQIEPGTEEEMPARLMERHERWQATSRFPKLLKDVYIFTHEPENAGRLRHFDPKTQRLIPVEWPASMADWRQQFGSSTSPGQSPRELTPEDQMHRTVLFARMSHPVWEKAFAIVSPMPMPFLFVNGKPAGPTPSPLFSYAIVAMDTEYLKNELLPSLAERHFSRGGASLDLRVAVVRTASDGGLIYSSDRSFAPAASDGADASADLLQVRTQDFATMAAEVRRFATFTTMHTGPLGRGPGESTRSPMLVASTPRMLLLTIRFRRLTLPTAASSEPARCLSISFQRGVVSVVKRAVVVVVDPRTPPAASPAPPGCTTIDSGREP